MADQRRALQAVLASNTFARNPRLTALLEYLCLRCFQGEASFIKEYSIATDVFGRTPDFDQANDAIVRVEMHRLRKKLKEFYAREGTREPVEIVIQSGRYQPDFVLRELESDSEAVEVQFAPIAEHVPALARNATRSPARHRPLLLICCAAALVLLGVASGIAFFSRAPAAAPVARRQAAVQEPVILNPVPRADSIRVLCGSTRSNIRDRDGNAWGADAFFSGGRSVQAPEQLVFGTRDAFLYRAMRVGEFSYKIPLRPGVYELRLYFNDPLYTPGEALEGGENTRTFNVLLNGWLLLRDFDIISDGGPNAGDVRVFKDIGPASDGYLHLAFTKITGEPLVNAIEVIPAAPHQIAPVRIVTQDTGFTDRSGTVWKPDDFFFRGRIIARPGTVNGPNDPQIYERERYGNFWYAIPVASGSYTLRLYFAESYWGPNLQGGGGVGSRVFDVYCNGSALLRNFDMYREAGAQRQIVKTFSGLRPNSQGKLLLSFVPVKNYANVSAIEVTDEDK